MSIVGERLMQGPNCDVGMEILLESSCDVTPLEDTHHLPHILFVWLFNIVEF